MRNDLQRQYTTVGRVVYDRPKHKFTDRDIYRVVRSRLKEVQGGIPLWAAALSVEIFKFALQNARDRLVASSWVRTYAKAMIGFCIEMVLQYVEKYVQVILYELLTLFSRVPGLFLRISNEGTGATVSETPVQPVP